MSAPMAAPVATIAESAGDVREQSFTISQLSAEFGLTPRTIRFYEDQGLISPTRAGQNRIYSRRDRARLVLICRGKRLGFSIAEIKEFIELYDPASGQIEQMRFMLRVARNRREALVKQLEDVKLTLAELEGMENAVIDQLRRNGISDTEIAAIGGESD
ncbi:MerR family transcriptional regulator [Radicibacter daui]|uniref:MerR family transcriptional regulator n=1 Tax=Radicibacter daui TaxID=3064829 RepID=UPI00404691AE